MDKVAVTVGFNTSLHKAALAGTQGIAAAHVRFRANSGRQIPTLLESAFSQDRT